MPYTTRMFMEAATTAATIYTLPNGLQVAYERRAGPGFALDLRLPVGSAHDPAGLQGAAAVLEEWLFRGAAGKTSRQLQDAFDDLGVRRGGGVGAEATRFGISGLLGDLGAALGLLADVLLRPTLPPEELDTLLDLAWQDLEALEDSPGDLLAVEARAAAFPDAPAGYSGYAHPTTGTREGLENITAEYLQEHLAHYGPCGSVLGLVADLLPDDVQALVQALFGDWQGGQNVTIPAVLRPDLRLHLPYPGGEQTHLYLLAPGVAPQNPDWLGWQLALTALSGGSSSRLFHAVREERGLAYAVSASGLVLGGSGFLNVYAGSTPEKMPETLQVVQDELERLSAGLSAAEFGRAHTALTTSVVFGGESLRGRAQSLTRDLALFGRVRSVAGLRAELDALTLAGVNEFLADYRPFQQATLVTLGPEVKG